jgi:hypothetical protein
MVQMAQLRHEDRPDRFGMASYPVRARIFDVFDAKTRSLN